MLALRCSELDNLFRFESGFLHRDNSQLCLTNDAGEKDAVGLKSLYLFDLNVLHLSRCALNGYPGAK